MLLPFGPDMVHGMTPHGARLSSPMDKNQYTTSGAQMQALRPKKPAFKRIFTADLTERQKHGTI
jgi:hypothetical protein